MSHDFQKHIFEAFTREKSSTVSGIQGTGLGMAITKSIVDIMGGTIDVTSELGKGTEFVVKLQFRISGNPAKYETIPELQGLRALVADNKIDEFFLCGADATACVKSTSYNMVKSGYSVHVISDCVTSYDLKKMDEMLEYYEKKGCDVKRLDEFVSEG